MPVHTSSTLRRGLVLSPAASIAVAFLGCSVASAGTLDPVQNFTNDLGSGINGSNPYSHKMDFTLDGSPATVNGLTFTAAGRVGPTWTSTNIGGEIPEASGGGNTGITPTSDGSHKLLQDFYYNNSGVANQAETITLRGLIPGMQYEFSTYWRPWVNNDVRSTVLNFDEGSGTSKSVTVDQDGQPVSAHYVTYHYTPGAAGTLVTTYTENGNSPAASWHQYAATNRILGNFVQLHSLFNTGVTNANDVDGTNASQLSPTAVDTGKPDTHWTVKRPDGSTVQAKTATDQGAYFGGDGHSTFINDLGSAAGGANGNDPAGNFVFATTVDVPGNVDPNSLILQGRFIIDNGVTDVLVNGKSTGVNGRDFGGGNWTEFTITQDFFQAGTNTLEFLVVNDGTDANPMALRVDGLRALGSPVPEPSSAIAALAGIGAMAMRRRR